MTATATVPKVFVSRVSILTLGPAASQPAGAVPEEAAAKAAAAAQAAVRVDAAHGGPPSPPAPCADRRHFSEPDYTGFLPDMPTLFHIEACNARKEFTSANCGAIMRACETP